MTFKVAIGIDVFNGGTVPGCDQAIDVATELAYGDVVAAVKTVEELIGAREQWGGCQDHSGDEGQFFHELLFELYIPIDAQGERIQRQIFYNLFAHLSGKGYFEGTTGARVVGFLYNVRLSFQGENSLKIVQSLGQGPVLNVLHGWGMNAHLFDDWSNALAAHYQVNLIDLPGHGLNHEAHLSEDLDELAAAASDVPAGIWLGWSMGGMLALNVALKKPSQVTALIMLCATPCFVQRPHWPHGTDPQVLAQFAANLQQDVKQTIQTFLALEVKGVADERQQLRTLRQKVFERPLPTEQALQAGLNLLAATDLSAPLKNLQQPSLWLSGRRDRLVLPQAMAQAAELCGGEYQLLRGSGHAPFIREADAINALINPFIQAHS